MGELFTGQGSGENANTGPLSAPTMFAPVPVLMSGDQTLGTVGQLKPVELVSITPPIFTLRPGRPTDLAYVIDSWANSDKWRPGAHLAGPIFRWAANKIINRPGTTLTIAADTQDSDAILGWSVTSGTVVFYTLVRKELRRKGLARALLAHLPQGSIHYAARPANGCPPPSEWTYEPNHFAIHTRA